MPVEIRWDSSDASARHTGGWAYHVEWSNGPTRTAMRQLVDELADQVAGAAGLEPTALVYLRTVSATSVALALLGNVAAGRPALGEHRYAGSLLWALDDVDYPKRGTDEARELAARLGRLTSWDADRMAELLDAHGLAALTGDLDPDAAGTVVPLTRPLGSTRALGFTRPVGSTRPAPPG